MHTERLAESRHVAPATQSASDMHGNAHFPYRRRSEERRVGKEGRDEWSGFQAEDGIRDDLVTGVQTCALPIYKYRRGRRPSIASTRPSWTSLHETVRGASGCTRKDWPRAGTSHPRRSRRRTCTGTRIFRIGGDRKSVV